LPSRLAGSPSSQQGDRTVLDATDVTASAGVGGFGRRQVEGTDQILAPTVGDAGLIGIRLVQPQGFNHGTFGGRGTRRRQAGAAGPLRTAGALLLGGAGRQTRREYGTRCR